MNLHGVYHISKSNYAYAVDTETVHLRLRTAKDDVDKVAVFWGDPFDWRPDNNANGYLSWYYQSAVETIMVKEYSTELFDYWFAEIKPPFGRVKYSFLINSQEGEKFFGNNGFFSKEERYKLENYFSFAHILEEDIFNPPTWVKDTVWYQIFVERFCNGDVNNDPLNTLEWKSGITVDNSMHFGGDLQGVITKLDYLKWLGINGIYFTPIFESKSTHKYDTENYFNIDQTFGSIDTLKKLVDEAHKRGIRVMLDAVFNHCGYEHPFWQDVMTHGKDSKYYDCFYVDEAFFNQSEVERRLQVINDNIDEMKYKTFGFEPRMPKWNTSHPTVRKHLLEVATFWITECDIDAWRLDVSNEVSYDFWLEYKKTVRRVKPDLFILCENWDNADPFVRGEVFDSIMNYEFTFSVAELMKSKKTCSNSRLAIFVNTLNTMLVKYPRPAASILFNLLESHDTSRILSLCENDSRKVEIAYVMLLTLGGTPSIFYGGEIGLHGKGDSSRQCMEWDERFQNKGLQATIRKLIDIRKREEALKNANIEWISIDDDKDILIYKKSDSNCSIFVILNFSDKETMIDVDRFLNGDVTDLINSDQFCDMKPILCKPYGFLILKNDHSVEWE